MSDACAAAFARALLIATVALIAAAPVHRLLRSARAPWRRRLLWTLLLMPLLTPPILVGYGWSHTAMTLVHRPWLNEALYLLIVLMKLTPAAVLVLVFAPQPPVSAEAMYCYRLAGRRPTPWLWARGPGRALLTAAAVVFLLAFQEFEVASLMGIGTWTVWLFDAQAGGLSLAVSLRQAILPLATQLLVLAAALALLLQKSSATSVIAGQAASINTAVRVAAWAYLLAAAALVFAAPAAVVLRGTLEGAAALVRDFSLAGEIRSSMLFAAAAAACAWLLTRAALGAASAPAERQRWKLAGIIALGAPGLAGSLLVAMVVLAVFQWRPINIGYDTPLPLLLTLTATLLPMGLIVGAMLVALGRSDATHAAVLLESSPDRPVAMAGRRLRWQLSGRAWWWLAVLLFYFAYFEVSASSLLAPSGMTPAVVRLYNLMHYGRGAVLSAMVCATLAAPVILLAMAALLREFHARGPGAFRRTAWSNG